MTAEVHAIRSGQKILTPEISEEIVKALEDWLERARAGEVVGISLAVLYRDNSIGASNVGHRTHTLLGEVFSNAHRIAAALNG